MRMEFIANKECICKKTMLTKGNKRSKSSGVLNPAFEDFDLSKIHFPESVSTSYLKADTISEEGFDSIQNYVTNSCPNSPLETGIGIEIETSSAINSMRATPLKKFKNYNNTNFSKYCVLILVWFVIVFSFAGIFASVATIIWLETYSEVKSNTIPLVVRSEDFDPIYSSIESLTQSTLNNSYI